MARFGLVRFDSIRLADTYRQDNYECNVKTMRLVKGRKLYVCGLNCINKANEIMQLMHFVHGRHKVC